MHQSVICNQQPHSAVILLIFSITYLGIERGSGKPNTENVGKVSKAQVLEIAKTKLNDTNATKVESVVRMIEGTARNMGIKVVE